MRRTDQEVTRREHKEDKLAKRVIGVDPFGGVIADGQFEYRFDSPYIGAAQIGTAENAAGWQIFKSNSTGLSYADGTDAFEKVWNDRATYTYSI